MRRSGWKRTGVGGHQEESSTCRSEETGIGMGWKKVNRRWGDWVFACHLVTVYSTRVRVKEEPREKGGERKVLGRSR